MQGINGTTVSDDSILQKAARDLWDTRGKSVVLAGSNDENVQYVVNAINYLLGAYDEVIDITEENATRAGNDKDFGSFVDGLSNAGGVIFYNCNPVYDHPRGAEIAGALSGLSFSVSTSDRKEETSELVKVNAPDTHYLEAWNDARVQGNKYSLSQPTISKIFDSRQAQESFGMWTTYNDAFATSGTYYDMLRSEWKSRMEDFGGTDFETFWKQIVHDGVVELNSEEASSIDPDLSGLGTAAAGIARDYSDTNSGLELVIYQNGTVGNGTQANNPWLQEMSEPITKACWDNYLTVSPNRQRNGVSN